MELRAFDTKIDEESQRILVALSDHGPSLASDLADRVGVDPQSVRYRIDTYLGPDGAGLVQQAGTRIVSGGEAVVYELTERGAGAIEAAPEEFAKPSDPAEYRSEINSLKNSVETLRERLEKESNRIDNRPTHSKVDRTQERMEKMVEQCEKQAERSWNAAEAASRRKEAVGGQVDDIETRVDELDDKFRSQRDDVNDITDDIDDLADRVDEVAERQERLNDRLLDVEQTQEKGLLKRLLPI